jgi:hypothetical protein
MLNPRAIRRFAVVTADKKSVGWRTNRAARLTPMVKGFPRLSVVTTAVIVEGATEGAHCATSSASVVIAKTSSQESNQNK